MGIGSILGAIGGLVAAPFTWGTSLAWLPAALGAGGGLADVLGGAAKSGQTQNNTNDQEQIALANAKTARLKAALDAPGERLKQSVGASLLNNWTPQKTTWGGPGSVARGQPITISGGVGQGLQNLDPATKALSQRTIQDELASQISGGPTGGNQDMAMPQVGQSSTFDKVLGGAGFGSSILAALLKAKGANAGGGGDMGYPTDGWDMTGVG